MKITKIEENKTKEAMKWIVSILRKRKIPFQITAGFAARIYGSNRSLYDIDIDIPEERIKELVNDVKNYIVKGPYHHKSKHFDLVLLTLNYKGQPIDLGGAYEVKVRNKKTGKWIKYPTDLKKSKKFNVFGMRLPVVTKEELVRYKSMVARPTDLDDVRQML